MGNDNGGGESMASGGLEMLGEVMGHLGHVAEVELGGVPLLGTAIHGGLAAYHGYEDWDKSRQADNETDPEKAAELRKEADHEGNEAKLNCVEAIPAFGTGFHIASTAYNLGVGNPDGKSAADKVFGGPAALPPVDVRGNPILPPGTLPGPRVENVENTPTAPSSESS